MFQKINRTGIPERMKKSAEALSGFSYDKVRVEYHSGVPGRLGAYAVTQSNRIYVAQGQEHTLGHELWHIAQQAQGRVRPSFFSGDVAVNDSPALEREADAVGGRIMGGGGESFLQDNIPLAAGVDVAQFAGKRREYLGNTPEKNSRVGKAVISRMTQESNIYERFPAPFSPQTALPRQIDPTYVLGTGGEAYYKLLPQFPPPATSATTDYYYNYSGRLYPIDNTANMGHRVAAVVWWDHIGYLYGKRAAGNLAESFMNKSENYELQPESYNKSSGARLKARYQYVPPPSWHVTGVDARLIPSGPQINDGIPWATLHGDIALQNWTAACGLMVNPLNVLSDHSTRSANAGGIIQTFWNHALLSITNLLPTAADITSMDTYIQQLSPAVQQQAAAKIAHWNVMKTEYNQIHNWLQAWGQYFPDTVAYDHMLRMYAMFSGPPSSLVIFCAFKFVFERDYK